LQHKIRCANTILTRKYYEEKNVRCGSKQEFGADEECVGLKERKMRQKEEDSHADVPVQ